MWSTTDKVQQQELLLRYEKSKKKVISFEIKNRHVKDLRKKSLRTENLCKKIRMTESSHQHQCEKRRESLLSATNNHHFL